jgi:hypothetical protein
MDLFEYIKTFYDGSKKFEQISDFEKRKQFFMFNRRMSIKYPEQANFFNFNGIDGALATDIWYEVIGKKSNGTPAWNYIKLNKKNKDTKKWYPKDMAMFKKYRNFYEMSIRDFNENLEYDLEKTKLHYETFVKNIED